MRPLDIDDGANLVRITINARQAEEEPQNNIPSMFDQLFGHVRSRKRRVPDDEPTTTAEPETTTELNVDKGQIFAAECDIILFCFSCSWARFYIF